MKNLIVIVFMIIEYIIKLKYSILLSLVIVLSFGYYSKDSYSYLNKENTYKATYKEVDTACVVIYGIYYPYLDYGNSIVFDNTNYAKPKQNNSWNKTFNPRYYYKIMDSCYVFVTSRGNITNKQNKCIVNYEFKAK